jgi:hypothetical protein
MSQASSTRGGRAAPSGSTATRGVIVVAAALIVGVLLIVKGGGGEAVADKNAEIDGTTTTAPGGGPTTTQATNGTTVPPAQLAIIAANGSKITGLAGKTKTQLAQAGYTSVIATDATTDANTSIVYFVAGFDKDAEAVAAVLGMPPARLAQMPDPSQVPVASVGDVKVVVVLGPDAPNAGATGATTTTVAP